MSDVYVTPDQERILWVGRPRPRRIFGTMDIVIVPFSIAWAAFTVVLWVVVPAAPWLLKILFA
jgi:hypothetical protein